MKTCIVCKKENIALCYYCRESVCVKQNCMDTHDLQCEGHRSSRNPPKKNSFDSKILRNDSVSQSSKIDKPSKSLKVKNGRKT